VLAGAVLLQGEERLARSGLEPLLAELGVTLGERVVLDPHGRPGATPLLAFTIADGWADVAEVRALFGKPVSFALVRELTLDPAAPGHPVTWLQTSEEAWAEADLGGLVGGEAPPAPGPRDRTGALPLVVGARFGSAPVVVVASDQVVSNANLRPDVAYDHVRELLVAVMQGLARREPGLALPERPREHVKLVLPPERLERMVWVAILGPPLFVLALGGLVRVRRRRS
jgi:hypothetical protein